MKAAHRTQGPININLYRKWGQCLHDTEIVYSL